MGIVRQIKNVTGGYTSAQVKVRNATSNDDGRPPRSLLQELSDLTYDSHEVVLIMDMLDKRLNDKGKYWRHVFKALILLDYLLHTGSDKVVLWCRENLYIVKTLREFHHRDDSGRDVGGSIRERARTITSLVMDVERLERERERYARGGRRPRRYRRRPSDEDDDDDASSSRTGRNRRPNAEDDELQRALELSRQTAQQEEERRRMAGQMASQSAEDAELQRAMQLTQQNQADMLTANYTGYDPYYFQQQQQQYLYDQQQQQEAALAQAQAEYLAAQHQAQQEAQLLYNMQQEQAEAAARQRAAQEAYQQQVLMQQTPLKTGSNNPFAAFNQAQQQQHAQQQAPLEMTATGSRPRLHRQSTFDKDHMDRLDQILSLEAPTDTFGNTGMAKMPAHHTQGEFVDSSGRGLTAMLTNRKTGQQTGTNNTNNPFAANTQQYTGIANTQIQPAHTGYGFGNANHSSANLIDL